MFHRPTTHVSAIDVKSTAHSASTESLGPMLQHLEESAQLKLVAGT